MVYIPIRCAPTTPGIILDVIEKGVDPLLHDVHAMLRLPLPGSDVQAGCNIALAQLLTSVVAGVSVAIFKQDGWAGTVFRELLSEHYPLDEEPPEDRPTEEELASVLWSSFRNPLAHTLGLPIESDGPTRRIDLSRRPLKVERWKDGTEGPSEAWLEGLERGPRPPLTPGLKVRPKEYVFQPEAFYWGVRRMIEKLTHDAVVMERAMRFYLAELRLDLPVKAGGYDTRF